MEGLESYLLGIFGPQGPLSSKNIQEKIPKMRFSRGVSETEVLKSQIEQLAPKENVFGDPKVKTLLSIYKITLNFL